MSKNTGCSQPNYLNPDEPTHAYYDYVGCSCGKRHIFKVGYKEVPNNKRVGYLDSVFYIPTVHKID